MKIGSQVRGYFLVVTGFLACPCHLPLTLPLLLALTAGTAVGVFLANNVWLIVGVSIVYFVGALASGMRYLGQDEQACELPNAQVGMKKKNHIALSSPRTPNDAPIREP
jgi:hypothetical protein